MRIQSPSLPPTSSEQTRLSIFSCGRSEACLPIGREFNSQRCGWQIASLGLLGRKAATLGKIHTFVCLRTICTTRRGTPRGCPPQGHPRGVPLRAALDAATPRLPNPGSSESSFRLRPGAPSRKGADIGKHVCYLLPALYWISTTFMLQGVSVRVSGIDWAPISVVVEPAHTGVAAFVWS